MNNAINLLFLEALNASLHGERVRWENPLEAQDWELAFRASHTLKGVAQNLGMDRLYKTAATLCDAVRGPKPLEDASLWPPVVAAHEEVLAAIREL